MMFLLLLSISPKITKFWGLLEYKPQWSLSLKAWLILGLVLGISSYVFVTQINAFLLVSKPLKNAEVLLVEGWLIDPALKGAFEEYQKGNYQRMITTGSPIERGAFITHYTSFADVAADSLIKMGIDPQKIVPITASSVDIDRTAAAAIAVKEWLKTSKLSIQSINLYSYDIHTRRSRLIYQTILSPEVKVGAIAHYSPYYDHRYWWTSSYGLKSMINEIIGYFYTRFIWFYFK